MPGINRPAGVEAADRGLDARGIAALTAIAFVVSRAAALQLVGRVG